jgi:hypothetical protein
VVPRHVRQAACLVSRPPGTFDSPPVRRSTRIASVPDVWPRVRELPDPGSICRIRQEVIRILIPAYALNSQAERIAQR